MARYIRKRHEVEAIQWTGEQPWAVEWFTDGRASWTPGGGMVLLMGRWGDNWIRVPLDHWVVRDVNEPTEYWVVDPAPFDEYYEKVQLDVTRHVDEHEGIEAIQWTGDNLKGVEDFLDGSLIEVGFPEKPALRGAERHIQVRTKGDTGEWAPVPPGYWIARHVGRDNHWVVSPDYALSRYELVEAD